MKKYKVVLLIIILISLSSCGAFGSKEKTNTVDDKRVERTEYVEEYLEQLDVLDATLPESVINDDEWNDKPWVKNRIQLPNSDIFVSVDILEENLYSYAVYSAYNATEEGPINLTAQDIIDLYSTPNEEKQAELDKLISWWKYDSGCRKTGSYGCFATTVYWHYKALYGAPYFDKEIDMCTAEEDYELMQWGIKNIDYDYTASILANMETCEYIEKEYIQFLKDIGVITADANGQTIIKQPE